MDRTELDLYDFAIHHPDADRDTTAVSTGNDATDWS